MRCPLILPRWSILAAVGLFTLTARAADHASRDAFLDQPFPAKLLETITTPPGFSGSKETFQGISIDSFRSGVHWLGKMSGKKVCLPAGLAEWPNERTETNWKGASMGVGKDEHVREIFNQLCLSLNLVWYYDAVRDVIDLAPAWRREDPRSAKELAGVLLAARAVPGDKLPTEKKANLVGGHSPALDGWRIAFDALLSKPANFSDGGCLRLYHDSHGDGFGTYIVDNLFVGKMRDADGHQKVVVLNGQEEMTNKSGPGEVAYYVFDEEGRLSGGGVYAMSEKYMGSLMGATAEGDQKVAVLVGWGGFPSRPNSFHFALVNSQLVLQGSTDSLGKDRDAEETRPGYFPDSGALAQLKFVLPRKPGP